MILLLKSIAGVVGKIEPSNLVISTRVFGSRAILLCSTDGGKVIWFNGQLQTTSDIANYDTITSYKSLIANINKWPISDSNPLILTSLISEDSGFYFCFASLPNRAGYSIAAATLKIHGKLY